MADKIDSNITGLSFAEETALKVLPENPVWYGLEPNSYNDFGGELSTVARAPIDPSRQNKKGTVTDLDASGGFNIDVTASNLTRLLQGFFFADAHQKPTTQPITGAAAVALSSVTGASNTYAAASGLLPFNKAGFIVYGSGFTSASNNGLKTVTTATETTVVVSEALADEASPPAAARLDVVGFQFPSDDVNIAVTDGIPSLVATATDLTTLGLIVGEWVFVGGDAETNRFANNVGYARVASISTGAIIFDDTTWTPQNEAGTGKAIRLFFGTVLRNEKTPSLIKRRSFNLERTLGEGTDGAQAEYLEGAVANEFTLNIPQADKLNADLSFVACDHTQRSGAAGDEMKGGSRVSALGQDAFNTSSNIYRLKLAVHDPATSNPAALFAYVTEANLTINNNVTPNKAVGVLGAFDVSAGNFVVSGSMTAYFSTIEAVRAVRRNADVGFNAIVSASNRGHIYDIPLLGLGGGRLNIEKDAPITVPLEPQAAECANGYTLLHVEFPYLPSIAMAD